MDNGKSGKTFFVVWTPFDKNHGGEVDSIKSVQVHQVPRCSDYTADMIDRAKTFYFKAYLPALAQTQTELRQIQVQNELRERSGGSLDGDGGGSIGSVGGGGGGGGGGGSHEAPLASATLARVMRCEPSEYERSAMDAITNQVVMASDGAPAVIVRRNQDEEREAAREVSGVTAARGERPSTQIEDYVRVSAGGFHFGKEIYMMNGEAGESSSWSFGLDLWFGLVGPSNTCSIKRLL